MGEVWFFISGCAGSSSRCPGFSWQGLLLLQRMGSRVHRLQYWHMGSAVVAHGLRCLEAGGILPDQGSNPCPLHWQADF